MFLLYQTRYNGNNLLTVQERRLLTMCTPVMVGILIDAAGKNDAGLVKGGQTDDPNLQVAVYFRS